MDVWHMMEIVSNLIEKILCDAKYDKPAVRDMLAELGWTDSDLEWFNVMWMFKEEE